MRTSKSNFSRSNLLTSLSLLLFILSNPTLGSRSNNIDISKLREFESVLRNSDAMKGIFISTSNFSSNCEKFASDNNISLINGNLLVDYFNQYGINSYILHK